LEAVKLPEPVFTVGKAEISDGQLILSPQSFVILK
jgi:hypothetical protein